MCACPKLEWAGEEMSVKTEDAEESMDVQICANEAEYDRSELPELLRIYYSKLFPYDKYFDWLHYGESSVSIP